MIDHHHVPQLFGLSFKVVKKSESRKKPLNLSIIRPDINSDGLDCGLGLFSSRTRSRSPG